MSFNKCQRQTLLALLISLTLHALLLLGFMLKPTQPTNPLSMPTKPLATYLYASPYQPKTVALKALKPSLKTQLKAPTKTLSHPTTIRKAQTSTHPVSKQAEAHHEQQKQNLALLALLHQAIQQQQEYPLSAQEMGRQGRVIVRFMLNIDGHIDQLRIMQSSATNSLDEAALAAVRKAAPFAGVEQYLNTPQEYSIAIVFSLH